MKAPVEIIKKNLKDEISSKLLKKIPDKWEKVGDVVVIVLPSELNRYKETIGEKYTEILNCKTVLNDVGGISGEYREPNVEIIYGSERTETVHKENGIRYKLDLQKVMFSSGNISERKRIATIAGSNETIVDLFAGIGYFTLPIAVYSRPKKIFAIEKNPISYNYLCQNITLNNVTNIVEPIHGDNRSIAPKNIADRVILGYFGDTHEFLPVAFDCLKKHCGIIHYHDTFPNESIPDGPMKHVEKVAEKYNKSTKLMKYKRVKSYAPGISHFVFDIKIGGK
ncbi:MAG: class I SAM-dependent methyltransferase family protein [Candidatus Thermoplasmatota archaeon]|nr:class I SAM-dependent methyltransferase family protein [Candidatus Thermoplasmatota archaeon]